MNKKHILKLYLLRHAIAVKRGTKDYPNDDRPLTQEGAKKMKIIAKGINRLGEDFNLIITSPMKRASQTAEILKKTLKQKSEIIVSQELLPGADSRKIARLAAKYKEQDSLVLVGHEPDFSTFASFLLGMEKTAIDLKKGGICRIDIPFEKTRGRGTLIWLLSPALLFMMTRKTGNTSI